MASLGHNELMAILTVLCIKARSMDLVRRHNGPDIREISNALLHTSHTRGFSWNKASSDILNTSIIL